MTIAEKIKAIREIRKIKQSDIARAIGIEPTNYPRIEKKGDNISYELLIKIAGALGISLLELITWGDEDQAGSNNSLISQLKARVNELEDRVKDKDKIIHSLETEASYMSHIADIYIWDRIYDIAMNRDIGEVILEYKTRSSLRIPMAVYTGRDKSMTFSEKSYAYDIILTDEQTEQIFTELLDDNTFLKWTEYFYLSDVLKSELLIKILENYSNSIRMQLHKESRERRRKWAEEGFEPPE